MAVRLRAAAPPVSPRGWRRAESPGRGSAPASSRAAAAGRGWPAPGPDSSGGCRHFVGEPDQQHFRGRVRVRRAAPPRREQRLRRIALDLGHLGDRQPGGNTRPRPESRAGRRRSRRSSAARRAGRRPERPVPSAMVRTPERSPARGSRARVGDQDDFGRVSGPARETWPKIAVASMTAWPRNTPCRRSLVDEHALAERVEVDAEHLRDQALSMTRATFAQRAQRGGSPPRAPRSAAACRSRTWLRSELDFSPRCGVSDRRSFRASTPGLDGCLDRPLERVDRGRDAVARSRVKPVASDGRQHEDDRQ